jgi:DNA-directed RNA polymerase specialized sigma24 family protein
MAIKDIFLPLVGEPDAAAIAAIDKCVAVAGDLGAQGSGRTGWWTNPPDRETMLAASEEFDNRRKTLSDALTVLNDRERRIFETRRLSEDPITLAELAEEFSVSRERVRQIEVRAFEKVQNAVKHRVAAMESAAIRQ